MRERRQLSALMVLAIAYAAACWGQEQSASHQESSQSQTNSAGSGTGEREPLNHIPMTPLTGVEELSPRSGAVGSGYLLPSVDFMAFGDTNPYLAPGSSRLTARSTLLGGVSTERLRRHSQLDLDYAGGESYYNRVLPNSVSGASSSPFGSIHQLRGTQSFMWRRWRTLLGDQLVYLPESAFGFSGVSGIEGTGPGLGSSIVADQPALNPTLLPNQTILAGRARRLSNAGMAELQYSQSKRSTLTATAIYGTLHFFDAGFVGNNYRGVLAGYNYLVTENSEIGIEYLHLLYKLGSINRDILSRGFQVAYGHRLAGKFSLKLSAGPLVDDISNPLGGSTTRIFLSTQDSLQYRSRDTDASLTFFRYTTGGAGVLSGAESDVGRLRIGRRLSRTVRGTIEAGHTFNQSLVRNINTSASEPTKVEAWEGGVRLDRELGRSGSFYLSYGVQRQHSNNQLCFANSCGRILLRQIGGIGFNWHGRPIHIH